MDYKELSKKSKDIGESLVDAGEKLLSPNICTAGNTLIEASVAIAELLERAEQAEAKLTLHARVRSSIVSAFKRN